MGRSTIGRRRAEGGFSDEDRDTPVRSRHKPGRDGLADRLNEQRRFKEDIELLMADQTVQVTAANDNFNREII